MIIYNMEEMKSVNGMQRSTYPVDMKDALRNMVFGRINPLID